jgi:hypothetical protein
MSELHLKKHPEVEQMDLQQDALLLAPANNHFRRPMYFIYTAPYLQKRKSFHHLVSRYIIIDVYLPTVKNCHLSCWFFCHACSSDILKQIFQFVELQLLVFTTT